MFIFSIVDNTKIHKYIWWNRLGLFNFNFFNFEWIYLVWFNYRCIGKVLDF